MGNRKISFIANTECQYRDVLIFDIVYIKVHRNIQGFFAVVQVVLGKIGLVISCQSIVGVCICLRDVAIYAVAGQQWHSFMGATVLRFVNVDLTYQQQQQQCCFCDFYRAMHFAALRSHVICPSVTLVDCDHIGWNSSEIISPLVSLGCSLSAEPNIRGLLQRNIRKFWPKVTHPLLI